VAWFHCATNEADPYKDWIAVPVPAYLPRDLVDQARFLIASRKGYKRKHRAREWELKRLMRCSCGQNMLTTTHHGGKYAYYKCKRAHAYGSDACPQKSIRVEKAEPLVWNFVSDLLSEPERIRHGIEALIRKEREGTFGDPATEIEVWEEKLADNARLCRTCQDQQAAGLMTLEELASRLKELDEARRAADAEVAALRCSGERVKELEKDREAVLATLTSLVVEALDELSGEERNRLYRILRLEIIPTPEGYETTGVLRTFEPTPADRKGWREHRGSC
jgi:site-specific DNA recombinase